MPRQQPKKIPNGLRFVRTTTWPAIYREWYRQEHERGDWEAYRKRIGYPHWRAWREAVVITPFRLIQKSWKLYHVTNPSVILDWHGGPFPRWKKGAYRGAETRSFRWLVADGTMVQNTKVQSFKKIPSTMRLFGLRYKNRIVILDGMHRCGALARNVSQGKLVKTRITIALADTKKLPKLKSTLV